LGHAAWIGLAFAYLQEYSVLQYVYGALAVALVVLPLLPVMPEHCRLLP
jgi:hypothetical protein